MDIRKGLFVRNLSDKSIPKSSFEKIPKKFVILCEELFNPCACIFCRTGISTWPGIVLVNAPQWRSSIYN